MKFSKGKLFRLRSLKKEDGREDIGSVLRHLVNNEPPERRDREGDESYDARVSKQDALRERFIDDPANKKWWGFAYVLGNREPVKNSDYTLSKKQLRKYVEKYREEVLT